MDTRSGMSTWVEVDLDALANNIKEARRLTDQDSMILAAVKADAYGHGAVTSSRAFLENGADWLGVARLSEAVELRDAGIDAPILNLGYTPKAQYEVLIKRRIAATIYTPDQAKVLEEAATKQQVKAIVHIKIDTGLNRLGYQPNE